MSETPHGRRTNDPPSKTPEQIAAENVLYSNQVCPCEEAEPESASEYEVPGEWVTYTGEVDPSIFEYAARHAQSETRHKRMSRDEIYQDMEHARQDDLDSDSSSDERSSPSRMEAFMTNEPARDEPAPCAPALDEADEEDAVLTSEEPTPSASASKKTTANVPSLGETAPSTSAIEQAAESAPAQTGKHKINVQILDEWSVFLAKEEAEQAAVRSQLGQDTATEARRRANAAEIYTPSDAARLAAEADRFDNYAVEVARLAAEAEMRAEQIAHVFAQATDIVTKEVKRKE